MTAIDGNYLKQEMLRKEVLSVVAFETEWSGSCQIVTPMLEELANKYDDTISFFKIDIEADKGIAYEYGIIELPTILFFQNGQVIDHITGLTSKHILTEKIEKIQITSND